MRFNFLHVTKCVLLAVLLVACKKESDAPATAPPTTPTPPVVTPPTPTSSVHITLGNPSNASTDIIYFDNYLMVKPQYVLSYSRNRSTPNWVSWHLDETYLGTSDRQDDFRADNTLPQGWFQVNETSYSNSGFDRGHNCPSADRTNTVDNNSATFLMTNMIPQAPNNNQRVWANFENYVRSLVNSNTEIYTIMGSYGSGGEGSNGGQTTAISAGRIVVPSVIWKVVVVMQRGDNDATRVSNSTRVITIRTPNVNTNLSTDWRTFRVSVDDIEAVTGYNLLSAVPAAIQDVIEARVDNL
jgi:endonuclease G